MQKRQTLMARRRSAPSRTMRPTRRIIVPVDGDERASIMCRKKKSGGAFPRRPLYLIQQNDRDHLAIVIVTVVPICVIVAVAEVEHLHEIADRRHIARHVAIV